MLALNKETIKKAAATAVTGVVTVAAVVGLSGSPEELPTVVPEAPTHPLQTQDLTWDEYLQYVDMVNEAMKIDGTFTNVNGNFTELVHQRVLEHNDDAFLSEKFE